MATYTVEVASISSRTVPSRYGTTGTATVYDIVTTTGKKVSYGFKPPAAAGISVGSKITFEGTEDKYGIKPAKDSVRLASPSEEVDEGAGGAAPAAAPRASGGFSGGSNRGSFPIAKSDGQIAIIRQNSLTNAVNLLAALIKQGGLVGEEGGDPASLAEMAIDLAYKFTEFSSGGRETTAVERIRNAATTTDDLSKALTAAVGK